jgi:acyl carrier protein
MGLINIDEKDVRMLSKEQIVGAVLSSGISVDLKPDMPTDESLEDLGLDSLDIFNVFVELETITGHMVPDSEIEPLQTVDDIHGYFASIEA